MLILISKALLLPAILLYRVLAKDLCSFPRTLLASTHYLNGEYRIRIRDFVEGGSYCYNNLTYHSGGINKLLFTTNLKFLISCSNDRTVKIWHISNSTVYRTLTHPGSTSSIELSADDELLAVYSYTNEIFIWSMTDFSQIKTYKTFAPAYDLKFSSDKRFLCAMISSGEMLFIDRFNETATKLVRVLPENYVLPGKLIAYNNRKNLIVVGSATIKYLEFNSNLTVLKSIVLNNSPIQTISLSDDESKFNIVISNYWIQQFDLITGEAIKEMYVRDSRNTYVRQALFSPDDKYVLIGMDNGTINIWDDKLNSLINTIPQIPDSVYFEFGSKCIQNCQVSVHCECKNNFLIYPGLISSPCQTLDTESCNNCPDVTCCSSPKFLSGSNCVDSCPKGFWGKDDTRTCEKCDPNCESCTGSASSCTSCASPYYLNSGKCVDKCPSPYFGVNETRTCSLKCLYLNQFVDEKTRICKNCDSLCLDCCGETNSSCLSCLHANTYYYQGACYLMCPVPLFGNSLTQSCDASCQKSNEFGDPSDRTCKTCNSLCNTCISTATTCTSCNSPYFLNNQTCLNQCPLGLIENDVSRTCDKCPKSNEFWDRTGRVCKACDPSCNSCVSGSSSSCSTCNAPKFLTGTSCVLVCPSPSWGNNSTRKCEAACSNSNEYGDISNNRICQPCDGKCATCSGTSVSCLSCSSPYVLSGTNCLSTCPSPNWFDSNTQKCEPACTALNEFGDSSDNRICKKCSENCARCSGTASYCVSCFPPYYLSTSQCVTACPSPSWGNNVTRTCELNCAQSNEFGDPSDNRICKKCDLNCATCSSSASNCLSCSGQMFLSGTKCVAVCTEPYWANNGTGKCELACTNTNEFGDIYGNRVCKTCSSSCRTCSGKSTSCTSCDPLYYLSNSLCVTQCPFGTWPDDKNRSCGSRCPLPLVGTSTGRCELNCEKVNEYGDADRICRTCDSSCQTCLDSALNCLSCKYPRYLYGNICVTSCPAPLWGSNDTRTCGNTCTNSNEFGDAFDLRICKSCNSRCKTCVTLNNCTSCNSPYYLSNNNCANECIQGEWASIGADGRICKTCDVNCLTCSGHSSNCLSCASSFFLNDASCVAKCPVPLVGTSTGRCELNCEKVNEYDDANRICRTCDSSCETCSKSASNCLSCKYPRYLNGNICVTSCPAPLWGNNNTRTCGNTCTNSNEFGDTFDLRICKSCNARCKACVALNNCTSCNNPYYLNGNNCVNECIQGEWASIGVGDERICKACDANCLTCSGRSSNCLTCAASFFSNDASCVAICPVPLVGTSTGRCELNCEKINEYGDANRVCRTCDSSCETCSKSASNCLSCKYPRYLYGNICVTSCPAPLWGNNSTRTCGNTCTNSNEFGDTFDLRICKSCNNSRCKTCVALNICTSCNSPYYLSGNNCVNECVQGEWISFGVGNERFCKPCNTNCLTCSGNSSNCLSCAPSFFLNHASCVSTCEHPLWGDTASKTCQLNCSQANMFGDNDSRVCKLCDSNCETCAGSPSNCLSCKSPLFLSDTRCISNCLSPFITDYFTNMCVKTCPPGFYEDCDYSSGCNNCKKCSACHKTCSTCIDYQKDSCLSCIKPLFLYQGTCYISCPLNTTENQARNICYLDKPMADDPISNYEKTGLIAGVVIGGGLAISLIIIIIVFAHLFWKKILSIFNRKSPYEAPSNDPNHLNIQMKETNK